MSITEKMIKDAVAAYQKAGTGDEYAMRQAITAALAPAPTTELLGYANVHRHEAGDPELGSADIDTLSDVEPYARDFMEHCGIAELRLIRIQPANPVGSLRLF